MGTVLTIMGGYYLLSGQAFKVAGEAAKWVDEKVNQSKCKKQLCESVELHFVTQQIGGKGV